MRVSYIAAAAVVAFGLGCNKSPEGGTPGTHATFKISLPTSKDIKQGNTETYDGSVDRGSDFKKDIMLSVSHKPEKVKVTLNKDTIKASDGDTKFTITVTADKDAAIGPDQKIEITGKPEGGGAPTTGSFMVKVTENK